VVDRVTKKFSGADLCTQHAMTACGFGYSHHLGISLLFEIIHGWSEGRAIELL
jgi:hypothetical protein